MRLESLPRLAEYHVKTSLFDFELPPGLVAQTPSPERSASRLLAFDRASGTVEHLTFRDILGLIPPGDLLVVNRSRVIPARLFTLPAPGTKPAEILLVRDLGDGRCEAMVRPGRRFKIGARHQAPGGVVLVVDSILESGLRVLRAEHCRDLVAVFREHGEMPLPPYITSRESSPERYQTVFASEEGSIAAPTAGLHFDGQLLDDLRARGVHIGETVLHVGLGTFKPVETDDTDEHVMHSERYYISSELADAHASVRSTGGSVWACGTTSVRSLESAMGDDGLLRTGHQETACFITPGYRFRAVDHLITNFHLPRSSLIMLVAAFCGRERILELYRNAIERRYRFFSFGDAMAII